MAGGPCGSARTAPRVPGHQPRAQGEAAWLAPGSRDDAGKVNGAGFLRNVKDAALDPESPKARVLAFVPARNHAWTATPDVSERDPRRLAPGSNT